MTYVMRDHMIIIDYDILMNRVSYKSLIYNL